MENIDLKKDCNFKYVYGAGTKESNKALIPLLSIFLEKDVKDVTVLNCELVSPDEFVKNPRLDIVVQCKNGDMVDVEMQTVQTKDDLWARFEYYIARMHSTQENKGLPYIFLKESIGLIFVNFIGFEEDMDVYYNVLKLYNQNHRTKDTFNLKLIVVELPKLKDKDVEDMNAKEKYMYYLNHCQNAENDSKMKVIKETEEGVRMAMERVKNADMEYLKRVNKMMDEIRANEVDYETKLKTVSKILAEKAKEEGLEQGLQQGMQQNLKQNILNMSEVMSPEDIAKALKLPLEKVKEILQ